MATQLNGDERAMRVAAMLLLSLPGTPFIYYGEEIGLPGDKLDEMIRTPMPWSGDACRGFTTGVPWEPLQTGWQSTNVAAQLDQPGSLLDTYRTWIGLRTRYPALATGSFTTVDVENPALRVFLRELDGARVLGAINLGTGPIAPMPVTVDGLDAPGAVVDVARRADSTPAPVTAGAVGLPGVQPGAGTVLHLPDAT